MLTIGNPALAGGSWLEPTWVRVEAGDTIALAGEVSTGQLGWVQEGPYFAYLSGGEYGTTLTEGRGGLETDVLLGPLEIDASGNWAEVSIAFTLPTDVPPGEYWVTICNKPCQTGLGDLIGSILFVGVDPPNEDGSTTAQEPTESGAAAAIFAAAGTSDAPLQASASLTLARPPARATGLDATWVAISAAFGLVVLVLVSVVRTKGG